MIFYLMAIIYSLLLPIYIPFSLHAIITPPLPSNHPHERLTESSLPVSHNAPDMHGRHGSIPFGVIGQDSPTSKVSKKMLLTSSHRTESMRQVQLDKCVHNSQCLLPHLFLLSFFFALRTLLYYIERISSRNGIELRGIWSHQMDHGIWYNGIMGWEAKLFLYEWENVVAISFCETSFKILPLDKIIYSRLKAFIASASDRKCFRRRIKRDLRRR